MLNSRLVKNCGRPHRLAGFCGHHGADFYGLPRNEGEQTIVNEKWVVPASYAFGNQQVVPLRAGEEIGWQMVGEGKGPQLT